MPGWTIWLDCLTRCPFGYSVAKTVKLSPLSPFHNMIWGYHYRAVPLLSQMCRGQTRRKCKSGRLVCSSRL